MHFLNSLTLLAFSLPLVAHSKSLYIDSSCTTRAGWDDYLNEARRLARRASERMDSASDIDFEAVFKRIFQTEKGSEEGKYARGILKDIVELTPAADLKTSDIRLFCDNDGRWGDERATGGWYDKNNEMVTKIEPSCKNPKVLGRCYERKAKPPKDKNSPRAGHNGNRIVVTICDETFTEVEKVPLRITEEVEKEDLEHSPIENLSYMVSATILHEFAHAVSAQNGKFVVKDLPDKDHAYGWSNVISKEASIAVKNADNYAFLGLWAVFGDFGYTLPRKDEPDREDDILNGYMYKYEDITKRMIRSLVAMVFSA